MWTMTTWPCSWSEMILLYKLRFIPLELCQQLPSYQLVGSHFATLIRSRLCSPYLISDLIHKLRLGVTSTTCDRGETDYDEFSPHPSQRNILKLFLIRNSTQIDYLKSFLFKFHKWAQTDISTSSSSISPMWIMAGYFARNSHCVWL